MMSRASLAFVVASGLISGCGESGDSQDVPDSGVTVDTAASVSPFVPQAIEAVIDSMITAINTANMSSKPPIAVLPKDITDFWAPIVTGANRMSSRLGCPSIVEAPLSTDPTQDVSAEQNRYIENYVAGGVYKGLAVAPFKSDEASVAAIDRFVETNGPVVTIDSDSPNSKRSYLIATANYQAGYLAGTTLAKALQPGDTVAIFGTTDPNWPSGMERCQGAEDGAAAGGLKVAPRLGSVWVLDKDLAALTTAMTDAALNLKGLICVFSSSFVCAQAAEQLFGAPGKITILGFDMTASNKTYFDKGYFLGIAVQRQYYMGEMGVLVPYAISVLGPTVTAQLLQPLLVNGTFIDTGADIITPANYLEYMAFLSTLGINQ